MKGKALLCLVILLSMALTLIPAGVTVTLPTMEVIFQATDTNTYIIEDCTPPVTGIKVDLVIHDVTDMWGWSTNVFWDPAVLNCTAKALGAFNPSGTGLLGVINNVDGKILALTAGTLEAETVDGEGVVVTLTFLCHHTGTSRINLTGPMYINYPDKDVFTIADSYGEFECKTYVGPPRPPVATFTPVTSTNFNLDPETSNVTVNFDGCASEGSYDSLPDPGTENPIIEYRWDFNDDLTPDYISTTKIQVGLYCENIQDYYCGEGVYFMGWSLIVEWDPTTMGTLVSGEKGPLMENVTGFPVIDMFPNPTGWSLVVFGAQEIVTLDMVQGSGIVGYLYFEPTYGCVSPAVIISESKISCWYYDAFSGMPVVCTMDYTPEFEPSYAQIEPLCTASWTFDDSYPINSPVTLTVYAPDCDPTETHLDFEDTASVTNMIHILPPVMGPDIDVYTEMNGIGKGCDKNSGDEYPPYYLPPDPYPRWPSMSDAYGPQEAVTLYAKVTYNNEPVENKMVAFEVMDPQGHVVAWRSAPTNAQGIATVTFRIPWMGGYAEDVFGAWLITGTVDIAEQVVFDKCRFRFGYIVSILDIAVDPMSVLKLEDLGVTVTLANIAFTSKNVYLTIVLYDECGVPINHFGSAIDVDPVSIVAPPVSLTIPKWAFVGTGTVYVNVFSKQPYEGGTPMCPEGPPTNFVILNTP
jgi:hypothetical protein